MTDYLLDTFVTVRPGEPYRLFPFGKLVKNGISREITPELAARFRLPHFKPAIKLGSHEDTTPAGGHLVGLEVRVDGLYGIPEFTDKGAQALHDGAYRYHSPEVIWEGSGLEDPQTGDYIPGPLIIGDALLHTPHLGEAAALYKITEVESMTVENVTVPKSLWEKVESWFVIREPVKEPPAPEPKTEPEPEKPDQFDAVIAERDNFKAQLEQLKAEQVKAEQLSAITSELQDKEKFGAVYVELKSAEEAAGVLSGMTPEQREWVMRNFKAFIAQIKESNLTEPVGSEGANDLDANPAEAFLARVNAYAAEKKVDFIASIQQVAVIEPELYQAYLETRPKRD